MAVVRLRVEAQGGDAALVAAEDQIEGRLVAEEILPHRLAAVAAFAVDLHPAHPALGIVDVSLRGLRLFMMPRSMWVVTRRR